LTHHNNDAAPIPPIGVLTPRKRTRRRPAFSLDQRGRPVALITLANGAGIATVDRADYDRLLALDVSMNWVLSQTGTTATRMPAVKVRNGATMEVVARLILEADPHSRVVYAARDRTDLRRINIKLQEVMARGEGERVSGIVNRSGWKSIAGTMVKAKARAPATGATPTLRDRMATERVDADAADRAAAEAASIRVARIKAEIEVKVAAGADRDAVTAEGMAQAKAERIAYAVEHGLDPATGRHLRPLSRAKRDKAKEAKAAARAAPSVPVALSPEVVATLPFQIT
jgi:hypothetical protein